MTETWAEGSGSTWQDLAGDPRIVAGAEPVRVPEPDWRSAGIPAPELASPSPGIVIYSVGHSSGRLAEEIRRATVDMHRTGIEAPGRPVYRPVERLDYTPETIGMCERCKTQIPRAGSPHCADCDQSLDDASPDYAADDPPDLSGERHLDALRAWLARPMRTR